MDASKSLSCENNNSSLFSAVPDSSNMYQNKDSNLISHLHLIFESINYFVGCVWLVSIGEYLGILVSFLRSISVLQ